MGSDDEADAVLCETIEEFERAERAERRERGYELAAMGLSAAQISERLGVPGYIAQKWAQRGRAGVSQG